MIRKGNDAMRRLLSTLLAMFVLLGVAGARADDLDTIISKKELTIGLVNQPPFAKYDPNTDAWSGANYDIGKLIADAAGAKLIVVEGTWQNMIPALQAGKIDVGLAPFYATPQRALAVWFTIPVRYDRGAILIRTDEAGQFKTMEDFNKPDVRFAAHVGSASERDVHRFFPNAKLTSVSTDTASLEVESGRANAWLADLGTISTAQAKNKEWATVWDPSKVFDSVPVSLVVRRGETDLVRFLDATIQYYSTQGTIAEIERKWGLPESHPPQ
jgi:ABC-type amino acid transport substrate-binding protein